METTRHVTATAYVVHDGATALHRHGRLGMWLPPGGHLDRDELPHEAAVREAREETGLDPTLLVHHETGSDGVASESARELPRPRHLMLADVNRFDDVVGHQHVDMVYYATVEDREVRPAPGEEAADAWAWFTADDLRGHDALAPDVVALGLEAIAAAAAAEAE